MSWKNVVSVMLFAVVIIASYITISGILAHGSSAFESLCFFWNGCGLSPQTIQVMAALAAPTAIGAVLIASVNADARSNKQLKRMNDIDENANTRQQNEWGRVEAVKEKEKLELANAIVKAISRELVVVVYQLKRLVDELQEMGTMGFKNSTPPDFQPTRPIFDAFSRNLAALRPEQMKEIVDFEPEYRRRAQSLRNSLHGPRRNRGDAIMLAREMMELCLKYRYPNEEEFSAIEKLGKLEIANPDNYLPPKEE